MEVLVPFFEQLIYYSLSMVQVVGDIAAKLIEIHFPTT